MKYVNRSLLFSLSLIAVSPIASAVETAKIIPAGITRARVVMVQTGDIKNSYNNTGEIESIASPLNKSITTDTVKASLGKADQAAFQGLVDELNALEPGSGNNLIGGNTYSDFSLSQRVIMPALEYGVSKKWNIGIRVPIISRTVKNNFRSEAVNNANSIKSALGPVTLTSQPAIEAGLNKIAGTSLDTQSLVQAQFTSKGYAAPQDFEDTSIGDIELGAKYNIQSDDVITTSVLGAIRLPTGKVAALNNPFDQGTGDGAWSYGLELTQNLIASRIFEFRAMARGIGSFQDTRDRVVPKDINDSLPDKNFQTRSVTRQKSVKLESELASIIHIPGDKFSVWGAYQHHRKGEDSFTDAETAVEYDLMANETNYYVNQAEVGLAFSTIGMYRKKQFAVPAVLEFVYNSSLSGKNAPEKSYGRMDIKLYF